MPISFPSSDYIKRFSDYLQPFSSQNLPYSMAAIIGLATVGALGGLYLYSRNKKIQANKPTPSLSDVKTPQEVTQFLENFRIYPGHKEMLYAGPFREKLQEHIRPYLKDGKIDSEKLFAQINRDLPSHKEGKKAVLINNQKYDGSEGKRAENIPTQIYGLLKKQKGQDPALDHQILSLMTLLQQGVFATTQQKMLEKLKVLENGFNLESCASDPNRDICGQYDLYVGLDGNITVTCWRFSQLKATNTEGNPFYREKPYAILREYIELDLSRQRMEEYWQVSKVIKETIS